MLEAYTTLGYLAAHTKRVDLLAWVTAVTYREPGMLAKIVSTLDVLSGGRAWLGIGAAWNDEESRGLGLHFPPTAERFERLEETLRICLQMWSDDDGPFEGTHYTLGRTLDSPHPLRRPAPADPHRRRWGEEDAAPRRAVRPGVQPVRGPPRGRAQARRPARALRGRRPGLRRDREDRHVPARPPRRDGENVDTILEQMAGLAKLGVTHVHGWVPGVAAITPLEILGEKVIPEADKL